MFNSEGWDQEQYSLEFEKESYSYIWEFGEYEKDCIIWVFWYIKFFE